MKNSSIEHRRTVVPQDELLTALHQLQKELELFC